MMKKNIIIVIMLCLMSCDTKVAGTLGGGYVYEFNCNEVELNKCLDSFEKKTKHLHIPQKWEKYNNWNESGYSFLKGKIFYMKSNSELEEEMYYVSVLGSSQEFKNKSRTSIRAVFRKVGNFPRWLYFEDISDSNAEIIENRFQKVVLNKMTKNSCKCSKKYEIIKEFPDN